jgi:hypothetical protein
MDLRKMGWDVVDRMPSSWGLRPVAGSCEHGNEVSGSVKESICSVKSVTYLVTYEFCVRTWCAESFVGELCGAMRVEGDLPRRKALVGVRPSHVAPPTDPALKWAILWTRRSVMGLYWNTFPWDKISPLKLATSKIYIVKSILGHDTLQWPRSSKPPHSFTHR